MRGMLIAVALIAGCGAGYYSLPDQDQSLYKRCNSKIMSSRCPSGRMVCEGQVTDEYMSQPDYAARKQWAVANGCPPAMVEPEKHVGQ